MTLREARSRGLIHSGALRSVYTDSVYHAYQEGLLGCSAGYQEANQFYTLIRGASESSDSGQRSLIQAQALLRQILDDVDTELKASGYYRYYAAGYRGVALFPALEKPVPQGPLLWRRVDTEYVRTERGREIPLRTGTFEQALSAAKRLYRDQREHFTFFRAFTACFQLQSSLLGWDSISLPRRVGEHEPILREDLLRAMDHLPSGPVTPINDYDFNAVFRNNLNRIEPGLADRGDFRLWRVFFRHEGGSGGGYEQGLFHLLEQDDTAFRRELDLAAQEVGDSMSAAAARSEGEDSIENVMGRPYITLFGGSECDSALRRSVRSK